MRVARIAAITVIALSLGAIFVACGAFSGTASITTDASAPSDAIAANDGAIPGADATLDAGVPTSDAAAPFCASLDASPIFCADFEESNPLSGFAADSGLVQLDNTLWTSPPDSMRATAPGGDDAYVQTPFINNSGAIQIDLDYYVTKFPSDSSEWALLQVQNSDGNTELVVTADNTGVSCGSNNIAATGTAGTWQHLRVQMTGALGATGLGAVTQCGAAPSASMSIEAYSSFAVTIGPSGAGTTYSPLDLRVDNFVIVAR